MTTWKLTIGYNSCNTNAPRTENEQWALLKELSTSPFNFDGYDSDVADDIQGRWKTHEDDRSITLTASGGKYEVVCRAWVRQMIDFAHDKGLEINLSVL
jgi:hypothetical protein